MRPQILKLLKESQGNILDDEQLINTLNHSKLTSSVIAVSGPHRNRCADFVALCCFQASSLFTATGPGTRC
jgi:hypothetical protein